MNTSPHPSDEVLVDLAMQFTTSERGRVVMDHMKECPACESRFLEIAAGWERAAVRVADLAQSSDVPGESAWARIRAAFSLPTARWATAAVAAAVLALLLFPRLLSPPQRLTTLPALTPDVLQRATLPEAASRRMIEGIEAYGRGDYEVAIAALSDVQTSGPIDALRRVYLASALAWSGRHEDAIATLENVPLDVVPNPWSVEAKWTLYVCLTETGQTEGAQVVLESLAEAPGEPGDRARALLKTKPER